MPRSGQCPSAVLGVLLLLLLAGNVLPVVGRWGVVQPVALARQPLQYQPGSTTVSSVPARRLHQQQAAAPAARNSSSRGNTTSGSSSTSGGSSSSSGYLPLCSATINYGASVGDSSKQQAAEVPIFVGSFSLMSQYAQMSPISSWVLGWQFAGGEHILLPRDVFGDTGLYDVLLSDQPSDNSSSSGQTVAVLSNTSMVTSEDQVTFSFVGRKGTADSPTASMAPFHVAPPSHLFFNNHFCLPLIGAATAAAGGTPAGSSSSSSSGASGQQEVLAMPMLSPQEQPRDVQVEYMPIQLAQNDTGDTALFAKTFTQFYFRITNVGRSPVRVDQLLLQYWFQGPDNLDTGSGQPDSTGNDVATAAAATQALLSGSTPGNSSSGSTQDNAAVQAALAAAQMRMVCNDATPGVGCAGLDWSITAGLQGVKGARYVLSIWFSPNTTTQGQPFLLIPSPGSNSSMPSNSTAANELPSLEAIVFLEPRRFFSQLNATEDYSYLDTPLLLEAGNGTGSNSSSKVVRRQRLPNPGMPVYLGDRLAWGSPPEAGAQVVTAQPNSTARQDLPAGSYCQPSSGGGQVCGVSMVYCCFGSTPLSGTVPQDWSGQLLAAGQLPAAGVSGDDNSSSNGSATNNQLAGGTSDSSAGDAAGSSIGYSQPSASTLVPAIVVPVMAVLAGIVLLTRYLQRSSQAAPTAKRSYSWFSACGSDAGMQDDSENPPDGGRSSNGSKEGSSAAEPARSRLSWRGLLQLQQPQDPLQRSLLPAAADASGGEQLGIGRRSQPQHAYSRSVSTHPSVAPSVAYSTRVLLTSEEVLQLQEVATCTRAGAATPWSWDMYQTAPLPAVFADDVAAVAAAAGAGSNSSCRDGHCGKDSEQGGRPEPPSFWNRLRRSSRRGRGAQGGSSLAGPPPTTRSASAGGEAAGGSGSPGNRAAAAAAGGNGCMEPGVGSHHGDPRISSTISNLRGYHTWGGVLQDEAFAGPMLDPVLLDSFICRRHTTGPPGAPNTVTSVTTVTSGAGEVGPGSPSGSGPDGAHGSTPQLPAWLGGWSGVHLGLAAPQAATLASATSGELLSGQVPFPGYAPIELNVDFQQEIRPHLGRMLGKGGYGQVFEAQWRGQRVAVKLLSVDSQEVLEDVVKEVALSACFRHSRHVVKLWGACLTDPKHLALIMELVEGGNLAQRIQHPAKRRLTYLEVLQLGWDVAAGLAYLHPAVVHRDLKPQNVLLDGQGRAKIADFGISRFKDPHRSYLSVTHAGGTPNYMAPELFNGSRVDEAADVYSLACILYEAWTRRAPFAELAEGSEDKNYNVLYKIIVAVAINQQRPPLPQDMPVGLSSLVASCWVEDPRQRPTVQQLMAAFDQLMQEELERLASSSGLWRQLSRYSSGKCHSNSSSSLPAFLHPGEVPGAAVEEALAASGAAAPESGAGSDTDLAPATTLPALQHSSPFAGAGGDVNGAALGSSAAAAATMPAAVDVMTSAVGDTKWVTVPVVASPIVEGWSDAAAVGHLHHTAADKEVELQHHASSNQQAAAPGVHQHHTTTSSLRASRGTVSSARYQRNQRHQVSWSDLPITGVAAGVAGADVGDGDGNGVDSSGSSAHSSHGGDSGGYGSEGRPSHWQAGATTTSSSQAPQAPLTAVHSSSAAPPTHHNHHSSGGSSSGGNKWDINDHHPAAGTAGIPPLVAVPPVTAGAEEFLAPLGPLPVTSRRVLSCPVHHPQTAAATAAGGVADASPAVLGYTSSISLPGFPIYTQQAPAVLPRGHAHSSSGSNSTELGMQQAPAMQQLDSSNAAAAAVAVVQPTRAPATQLTRQMTNIDSSNSGRLGASAAAAHPVPAGHGSPAAVAGSWQMPGQLQTEAPSSSSSSDSTQLTTSSSRRNSGATPAAAPPTPHTSLAPPAATPSPMSTARSSSVWWSPSMVYAQYLATATALVRSSSAAVAQTGAASDAVGTAGAGTSQAATGPAALGSVGGAGAALAGARAAFGADVGVGTGMYAGAQPPAYSGACASTGGHSSYSSRPEALDSSTTYCSLTASGQGNLP